MAYKMYFDKLLMPVTPDSITVSIGNQNETVKLINDGEVNVLKKPGLKTARFTLLLPNQMYNFATYTDGYQSAEYYLNQLEKLKKKKKSFRWIVTRTFPDNRPISTTNICMVIEDYTVKENAKEDGFDVRLEVNLKEYVEKKTKSFKLKKASKKAPVAANRTRPSGGNAPSDSSGGGGGGGTTYVVKPALRVAQTVTATSVMGAIIKVCGSNYSGLVTVNSQNYYLVNGKFTPKPEPTVSYTVPPIPSAVDTGTADKGLENQRATAKSPVTNKTTTTLTKKISYDQSTKLVDKW